MEIKKNLYRKIFKGINEMEDKFKWMTKMMKDLEAISFGTVHLV